MTGNTDNGKVVVNLATRMEDAERVIKNRMYPELWQARNELTEAAKEET